MIGKGSLQNYFYLKLTVMHVKSAKFVWWHGILARKGTKTQECKLVI